MNKVILVGRVGKGGATVRKKNDKEFVTLTLATTERFKDKEGEAQERTEWHNVVTFRPGLIQLAKNDNLRQGSLVSMEGMLRTREYTKDDVKKYATSVVADTLSVLRFPPKAEKEQPKAEEKVPAKEPATI